MKSQLRSRNKGAWQLRLSLQTNCPSNRGRNIAFLFETLLLKAIVNTAFNFVLLQTNIPASDWFKRG